MTSVGVVWATCSVAVSALLRHHCRSMSDGGQEDFRGIKAPVCRIERGERPQKPTAALCRRPLTSCIALQCRATLCRCTAEL